MFYDEKTEREILHSSTSRVPYDNKKLVKRQPVKLIKNTLVDNTSMKQPPRAIGGSKKMKNNGVSTLKPPKLLYSSSLSGGAKREPTEWQKLLKKTREEKGLNLKDAMKYVKDNNLY
jgi:hypothetical protein